MKKHLLFTAIALLPLLETGSLWAQPVVRTKSLDVNYSATPPTVTFSVYWDDVPTPPMHRDTVWVFVDYAEVTNGVSGPWAHATLSGVTLTAGAGTVVAGTLPGRGFFLAGLHTNDFSSTLTATLGADLNGKKFNWCVYATDYPPNAEENAGRYYDLRGTPPFVINGTITESSKTYSGGCIESLTDETGCPGWVPAPPAVSIADVSPATVCPGGTVTLTAAGNSAVFEYSLNGVDNWQSGPVFDVVPRADTAYTVYVRSLAGCTASSAPASVSLYAKPEAAFSSTFTEACAGSEVTLTATGGVEYCFSRTCENCIRNHYLSGNNSEGAADCDVQDVVCTAFDANDSYTFTMPESGSVTIRVEVRSADGCTDDTSRVLTTLPLPVLTLVSPASTTQQAIEAGVAIAPIVYTLANTTNATVDGLPDGLTGSYTDGAPATLTISGTPTVTGAFSYTINLEGACASTVPATLPQRHGVVTVACANPLYPNAGTFQDFDPAAASVTDTRYSLTDARDNKTYNVVKIGSHWVMAQNLNYQDGLQHHTASTAPSTVSGQNTDLIGHFWCPGGDGGSVTTSSLASCNVWGALYTWETAMMADGKYSDDNTASTAWTEPAHASSSNTGHTNNGGRGAGQHGICPTNWHIPTDAEWGVLLNAMESGASTNHNSDAGERGADAGVRGKALCTCADGVVGSDCVDDTKSNWHYSATNRGTDNYGFRALPAGLRQREGLYFDNRGERLYLLSSSAYDVSNAWYRRFDYQNATVYRHYSSRSFGNSVRCIRN
jgi:uncharacterized protein (TIGR02145 family)